MGVAPSGVSACCQNGKWHNLNPEHIKLVELSSGAVRQKMIKERPFDDFRA